MAPEEPFLLLSTIFCHLLLDFHVKTETRFSLRDKHLFKICRVEIRSQLYCIDMYKVSYILTS